MRGSDNALIAMGVVVLTVAVVLLPSRITWAAEIAPGVCSGAVCNVFCSGSTTTCVPPTTVHCITNGGNGICDSCTCKDVNAGTGIFCECSKP
jgi:hypothetical protein